MSHRFEKDLRDHLHREAAQAKDLPQALPRRIRRAIESSGRFTPMQQLALVSAMVLFVAAVGFLVVQVKGARTPLPAQHNQTALLPGFSCTTQQGGAETAGPFQVTGIGILPGGNSQSRPYDQLIFQFDSGVPPYALILQSSPTFSRYDGSAVTLLGSSGIRLKFGNVRNTDLSKISYSLVSVSGAGVTKTSPTDFTPRVGAIQEVAVLDNSQSTIQYGIGLSSPVCFRVVEHHNPAILEIDVQTTAPVARVPFQVRQLLFSDRSNGWVLGTASKGQITYLVLARTSDGGATWRYLPFQNPSIANASVDTWHIYFETPQVGWLYGPQLYRTNDGGQTWVLNSLPGRVEAIASLGNSVWAVAFDQGCPSGPGCPQVEVSTDAGETWTSVHSPIWGPGVQILRNSPATGWILSWRQLSGGPSSSLSVTHDGGVTWQKLTTPCAAETSFEDRMAVLNDDTIWIVCGSQQGAGSQQKQLITSTDGGRHWSYPPNPPSDGYVQELALSSPTTGWLAGAGGPLYVTTDTGHTWSTADARGVTTGGQAGSGAIAVSFIDGQHGWAASDGEIFRTTDGGAHWASTPAEALEGGSPVYTTLP